VCGRPFLIDGVGRTAPATERADWVEPAIMPDVSALSGSLRAELTEHWTRIALMEHASIAAFARFALHLLAVAAPAELVGATHEAMADETRHTRLAFALASAYAGRPVGPSSLATDRCLGPFEIESFVTTLVREGCIGETVAAVEAREALGLATDPAVRLVWSVIARDELRHAELAWRTLRWLIATGKVTPAAARTIVARAASKSIPRSNQDSRAADLIVHGLLSDQHRAEVTRRVLAQVIEPCARALLTASKPTFETALLLDEQSLRASSTSRPFG
jgi:hypothetical protein